MENVLVMGLFQITAGVLVTSGLMLRKHAPNKSAVMFGLATSSALGFLALALQTST